jgi:hypothetical protein
MLRRLGTFLGATALAGLGQTGACAPRDRDFGTGGAGGGSTTTVTSTTTGAGGSGGSTCKPGEEIACYGGPDGTLDIGACKAGVKLCNEAGDGYGPCMGEVLPSAEDCASPGDEDCNGSADTCPLTTLWANAPGTAGNDNVARAVAVGPQGNIFVTGTLDGTIVFDPAVPAGITSAGSDDIYVAKYSPDGALQWVKTYGDSQSQTPTSIVVGKNAHIYVGGYFSGKAGFGNGSGLLSDGGTDGFILELDQAGNTVKAIGVGGLDDERVTALAQTSTGEIIAAGQFNGKISFPQGPTLEAQIGQHVFFARLTPALQTTSAVASLGSGNHVVTSIAVAPDDTISFAGYFSGKFGIIGGNTALATDGDDIVVGRINGALTAKHWMHVFNGATHDKGSGIATDSQGNVLLGGYFGNMLQLGDIPLTSVTPQSLFVAKLSPMGIPLWAHAYGASFPDLDLPVSLAVGAKDSIVIGGCYFGTADFGGGPLTALGGANDIGAIDAFLAKVDAAGEYIAAKSFGNLSVQAGLGVAVTADDEVVYCGATGGPLDFGTGLVGPADLQTISPFLAKLTP